MADKIILRFLRPATPSPEEFQAARDRLAADAGALLSPLPGFFRAFAEHFRNIRAGLIWAAIFFGLGHIHDNLQFLFYVTGFFLLNCIITLFRIFESLEGFGDLRDRHRDYYRELADDIRACSDYASFYELREGKEASRLYR